MNPIEVIETKLLPSVEKIGRNLDSASGLKGSGTSWTYDERGRRREDSAGRKGATKRKRRRSGSSGSSSSDDEDDDPRKNDLDRQVATIGVAVDGLKEKIDMFMKQNKKSSNKVTTTCCHSFIF